MAINQGNVDATEVFKKVPLLDKPVKEMRKVPAPKPNPFTGLGQTDKYARDHHLVGTPPLTVKEATEGQSN